MDAGALDKVYKDSQDKMEKAVASLKEEMGTIRTGRASPALLDRIKVDYYGAPTDLRALASVIGFRLDRNRREL